MPDQYGAFESSVEAGPYTTTPLLVATEGSDLRVSSSRKVDMSRFPSPRAIAAITQHSAKRTRQTNPYPKAKTSARDGPKKPCDQTKTGLSNPRRTHESRCAPTWTNASPILKTQCHEPTGLVLNGGHDSMTTDTAYESIFPSHTSPKPHKTLLLPDAFSL